jgi:hypothetical protein
MKLSEAGRGMDKGLDAETSGHMITGPYCPKPDLEWAQARYHDGRSASHVAQGDWQRARLRGL